jgi:hypothetical protein
MLTHTLIELNNRLQCCIDLLHDNQHLPVMSQNQKCFSEFIAAKIPGTDTYSEFTPSLLWKPRDEALSLLPKEMRLIESNFVLGNEDMEAKFHEMFGPYITDDYHRDIEDMLSRILHEYGTKQEWSATWFTCSTVRLYVSARYPDESVAKKQRVGDGKSDTEKSGQKNGAIIFEIIFIRPRIQRMGILGKIMYYMANHLPEACDFIINHPARILFNPIEQMYHGGDNMIFEKIVDEDNVKYTMTDKSKFVKEVGPYIESTNYPETTSLNENISDVDHSRKVWAVIAVIVQKYDIDVGQILIKMHFKTNYYSALRELRLQCDTCINFVEIPTMYPNLIDSDRDILIQSLKTLQSAPFLTKDVYAKDYEKLKVFQDSLKTIQANIFLSFARKMGLCTDIRFISYLMYKELLRILDEMMAIMGGGKTCYTYHTRGIKKTYIDTLSPEDKQSLFNVLRDFSILKGLKALFYCGLEENSCSFTVTELDTTGDPNPRPRYHIKFEFASTLTSDITDFTTKIPAVIQALTNLCML